MTLKMPRFIICLCWILLYSAVAEADQQSNGQEKAWEQVQKLLSPSAASLDAVAESDAIIAAAEQMKYQITKAFIIHRGALGSRRLEMKLEAKIAKQPTCPPLNPVKEQTGFRKMCILTGKPVSPCNPDNKYRTINGTCNNLYKPLYGSSSIAFLRFVEPQYADGYNSPRALSVDGNDLRGARSISLLMSPTATIKDERLTNMAMLWGQFLIHDISLTPLSKAEDSDDESAYKCAARGNLFPIRIPKDDPYFLNNQGGCINFTRSLGSFFGSDQFMVSAREQLNDITAYIDASNIYGSTKSVADSLRAFTDGLLNVTEKDDRELLPLTQPDKGACFDTTSVCFLAGDRRSNENAGLAAMHTIWLRKHNQIARKFAAETDWDDEKIYQETRRIIGALNQHITYNEYLPVIIGEENMIKHGLKISTGNASTYDETCDVSVANVFTTAAFRFGHSQVGNHIFVYNKSRNDFSKEDLVDHLMDPSSLLLPDSVDAILLGDTEHEAQIVDRLFAQSVQDRLFETDPVARDGLDLMALNIQRGRDHGLAPYGDYRKHCRLSVPNDFDDLDFIMENDTINALKNAYSHVADIDVFVGVVSEKTVSGDAIGPLGLCIFVEQFKRLKICDRYWYEDLNQVGSFTPDQLAEIKKMTLARVMCDVAMTNDVNIKENVFLNGQAQRKCSSIPGMSLAPWLKA